MRTLSFSIPPSLSQKTVKSVLHQKLKMSNALISRIKLRDTGILLNNIRVRTNHPVQPGDILTVEIGDLPSKKPFPAIEIPFSVLWEDEDLLILDKPAGLAVHGKNAPYKNPTLANALAFYLGPQYVLHPVNRLDRGTSGVMTIAKNSYIHDRLCTDLQAQNIHRTYYGIVEGRIRPEKDLIDLPIGRSPDSIIKRQIISKGQPAQTFYETVHTTKRFTLLKITPKTGRTHQIRLHLSAIGFPLVGDWLYGTENPHLIPRPALHSYQLYFLHPLTQKPIQAKAPLPLDMLQLLHSC